MSDGATKTETMLEHLGGREKLLELVRRFHHLLLEDELVGAMFRAAKPAHSAHLAVFFEEVMGGRTLYTDRLDGVEGLFRAHRNLAITEPQRQRFVELMLQAARDVGLPDDERFRSAFSARIEAGSTFSKTFSQRGAARLSPWPPVGTFDW